MSAAEAWGGVLAGSERAESIVGLRLQALFQLLGVAPALGRTFDAQDFRPGQDQVVVLSHSLWERRFGGDKAVVGRSVTINSQSYVVIGVMPPQFQFAPFWVTKAEMWSPLQLAQRARSRTGSSLRVFARLRPGVGAGSGRNGWNLQAAGTGLSRYKHRPHRASRSTPRKGGWKHPTGSSGPGRSGPVCSANRLRECGESAACPGYSQAQGTCSPCCVGSEPCTNRASIACGKPGHCHAR